MCWPERVCRSDPLGVTPRQSHATSARATLKQGMQLIRILFLLYKWSCTKNVWHFQSTSAHDHTIKGLIFVTPGLARPPIFPVKTASGSERQSWVVACKNCPEVLCKQAKVALDSYHDFFFVFTIHLQRLGAFLRKWSLFTAGGGKGGHRIWVQTVGGGGAKFECTASEGGQNLSAETSLWSDQHQTTVSNSLLDYQNGYFQIFDKWSLRGHFNKKQIFNWAYQVKNRCFNQMTT